VLGALVARPADAIRTIDAADSRTVDRPACPRSRTSSGDSHSPASARRAAVSHQRGGKHLAPSTSGPATDEWRPRRPQTAPSPADAAGAAGNQRDAHAELRTQRRRASVALQRPVLDREGSGSLRRAEAAIAYGGVIDARSPGGRDRGRRAPSPHRAAGDDSDPGARRRRPAGSIGKGGSRRRRRLVVAPVQPRIVDAGRELRRRASIVGGRRIDVDQERACASS